MSLAGTRVLFFAAPLYEDLELWYPKIRLEEEDAHVDGSGDPNRAAHGTLHVDDRGGGLLDAGDAA